MTLPHHSEKHRIQKHFDSRASRYESSAILQREVCQRMLDRLQWLKLQPQTIVDVGTGTGWGIQGLMKYYRSARVMALDLSMPMLQQVRAKSGWFRKPGLICADAEALPLADESVDMIFSNLMLQWCHPETVFAEFKRILRPGGVLMFSTFGPDTLKELRHCWAQVDDAVHVNEFTDMHDLGDALLVSGFAEPVMDADLMTLTYQHAKDVMLDLKNIGANTPLGKQPRGLVTPRRLQNVLDAYETFRSENVLPASFEVVYGHAWKPEHAIKKSNNSEIKVPLDTILKSHK